LTNQLKHLPINKYGLALHTTTPELGLAISSFQKEMRCRVWNLERELSSQMHGCLSEFIQPQTWNDLAFIAVAKGPGGFTGSRIGVVTARTLGQQLNIPVFTVSTLAAVAFQQGKQQPQTNIAVEMPAQRGKLFGAIYQLAPDGMGVRELFPDTLLIPEVWQEQLANWDPSCHLVEAKSNLAVTVTDMLEIAYFEWQQGVSPSWEQALPYYGQNPID
jgi:tRNA threonylcarbamoyl adenosine modification protein YeaZ